MLESMIKDRFEEQLKKIQNPLQRGFIEKTSSKFTAFINYSFAFQKCSACIPVSTADLPVLSFSIAFIYSIQVVGVIGIFVLVEVDIM
jgi:hypothetical protein